MAEKILVIGGGAREHALVWALAQSHNLEIVCAPGNPGIAALARCRPLQLGDIFGAVEIATSERPALTVVGPELPLSLGLVDELQARDARVFGPTRAAAMLETSKSFAKDFMRRHEIPTAANAVCTNLDEVAEELARFGPEVVVKADGLAAGKGVILCGSHGEAMRAATDLFSGAATGTPETTLLLEELLTGEEVSFFALSDGQTALPLAAAQDHKRLGEGDTGPNTGGMGAYSTDALLQPAMADWIAANIAQRVVDGMRSEGEPFRGVLFCGLMLTAAGPMVLEFNTRFGDPETEALVLRLETPLLHLLDAAVDGIAPGFEATLRPGAAASVVVATPGYPARPQTGAPILGLEAFPDSSDPDAVHVFQAGTAMRDGRLVTAGGRVLAVSAASARGLEEALRKIYRAVDQIEFPGMQVRRDIGWRALQRPSSGRSLR